jgi:hypothetical protein
VPAGHYLVMGERLDGPNIAVSFQGLIPAAQILKKLN